MNKIDRVSAVAFYPLKGAHSATVNGEVPQSLGVGITGFEVNGVRDRDFVLFDPVSGTFVSQRGWSGQGKKVVHPVDRQLATVTVDVRGDHLSVASAVGQLELPAIPTEGKQLTLDIFGKQLPAIDQGPDAARYFSSLFGRELRMVRSDRDNLRMLPDRYQRDGAFNQVSGADGMPFLLTSEASLAAAHEANGIAAGSVPINRYRGNITIDGTGLGAFGEDYVDGQTAFTIGDIAMYAVKACSRCPVPNVDQQTGEVGGDGLRVLRGRAGEIFTGEKGVFFGQNLTHANLGAISVGDLVVVDGLSPAPNIDFR
jgi:uncharacterized protein YcbX